MPRTRATCSHLRHHRVVKNILLICLYSMFSLAGAPQVKDLPKALSDWPQWVLHDEKELACPVLLGGEIKKCSWPGRLALKLEKTSGTFSQTFTVYREGYEVLPGSEERWPQDVKVDGKNAIVLVGDALHPSVLLSVGEHTVSGTFLYDNLPESILIPVNTGLVSLVVNGKSVVPNRDPDGQVFLQREAAVVAENDTINVAVQRLMVDEIPFELDTHIQLNVSGQNREIILGKALPPGFTLMSIESPLPLRVEPDGKIKMQIRAGPFSVMLRARNDGNVTSLKRPVPDGLWAESEEIWAFSSRPSLRQVLIEGVPAVDPSQTTLPNEWKAFPAFLVGQNDEVKITERQRGDSAPAPDVLNLSRSMWLDFDGQGYTVSDKISGQLHRSWRLDVLPETELGRVVASGADQQITRLSPTSNAGVELRDGALNVEAESRITKSISTISAVSWDADFNSVDTTLQMPPGFRLLWAQGADDVSNTWLSSWTLFDIFLVLLIAVSIARLFSLLWGIFALISMVLLWQEPSAPTFIWLAVLTCEALYRVLPVHWIRTLMNLARMGSIGILLVMSVMFAVQHVRHGMYPALSQEYKQLGGIQSYNDYWSGNEAQYDRSSSGSGYVQQQQQLDNDDGSFGKMAQKAPAPVQSQSGKAQQRKRFSVLDYDKNATVQTGPGLPRWDWNAVSIRFSGPVQKDQRLSLYLLGPATNFVLAFLRVILLGILLLLIMNFPGSFWPKGLKKVSATVASLLFALVAFAAPNAWAQESNAPSDSLLAELKARLLVKPECAPFCASSPRLFIDASKQNLSLRMEVLVASDTAIPLPGSAQQWIPETVVVDGKATAVLNRDEAGVLWLALKPGAHQVLLSGALPNRDTIQLGLLLRSFRVEAKLSGWTLGGLHEDGVADDTLQLSRESKSEAAASAALQTGNLPAFVRVERTLHLGLEWTVETVVRRLTPTGSAVVLEVPLLAGESVTSSEVRVQNQNALVNLGLEETEINWSSRLETKPVISLTSPKSVAFVEIWRVDASPVWHATFEGIPVVHQQDSTGVRLPEWRPWPGESVTVSVSRPESVKGQTLTVDQSQLSISPGVRACDVKFTANFRSSRGGLHPFAIPVGALLQEVKINGQSQPIRQEGQGVSVPLVPGSQSVELSWREPVGLTSSYVTDVFEVGTPSVNADVELKVPQDRWVLWVHGPGSGPAVLFWSFLLVLLVVSIGLSKTKLTPLTSVQFVLLSLGLSQVPIVAIAFVFAWLLFIGYRAKTPDLTSGWFNLRQLAVVAATGIALIIFGYSVYEGLLGRPEMQVQGNGSNAYLLRWFVDRTGSTYPSVHVISVNILVYRFAMLAWSLWMALSMLKWLKWGWQSFSNGGLWKTPPRVLRPNVTVPPGVPGPKP
jgi:hypothetical protein